MPKKTKKKAKKKAKKKVSKKTGRKHSTVAKVASLSKKPLGQLLTLQARVAKAMEMRVKRGKAGRKEREKGIMAGLFAGPRRPSKEDKAFNAAQESISRFSAQQMARLASRAGD